MNPPKVKICGLTRVDEALLAARLGADFLGLNFYRPSPRYLAPRRAAEIAAAVRAEAGERVRMVGVFVDSPSAEIAEIAAEVGLDLVQLHGDETPAEVAPLAPRAIKALRVEGRPEPALFAAFEDVWGFLVDTRHPKLYGGTGESWDFASLAPLRLDRPTFIAGGLGPANVRAALRASDAWGVDVCSGVESAPGRKDPALLDRLFKEIHDGQSPAAP